MPSRRKEAPESRETTNFCAAASHGTPQATVPYASAPSKRISKNAKGPLAGLAAAVARSPTSKIYRCELCPLEDLAARKYAHRRSLLKHQQEVHGISTLQRPSTGRPCLYERARPLIMQGRERGRPRKQVRTGKRGRPRKNPPGVALLSSK